MTKKLAILCSCALLWSLQPSFAQESTDTQSIIDALALKPKTKSLSLQPPAISTDDEAFIDGLRASTKSISVIERKKISDVIATSKLPSIDLEILFDYNSAAISEQSMPDIVKLGQALTSDQLRGFAYLVAGHTDARGSDDYNQALSQRRALAVKNVLESSFNISSDQLVAAGFGEENLKDENDPEGAENRRVQIVRLTQ
jgi:outer membrane protein OmpA-like peptidoglycan-associated protein